MTAPPTQAVTRMDEIRLRPVVTVSPDAPVAQVARIMRAHNVSALVVGNPGDPVTPETVFVRLQRITIDAPENWLG